MSKDKKRLENNKEIVDSYIEQKKVSYAETIEANDGIAFLQYMLDEGLADDLGEVSFTGKRVSVANIEVFPMIYMLNILSGEWSNRRTKIILENEAMMKIMGFSDEKIKKGLTKRGTSNQYGDGYERISGVMASTTIIDNLARFEHEGLVESFNRYIKRTSEGGVVDFGDVYILDSTIVKTYSHYPGAELTRRKKDDDSEETETIWGFKVYILTSAKTKTPVAVDITPANVADSTMLTHMVQKGIDNLPKGKIKIVLADRGFIDGAQMYKLKYKMNTDFVIPAKKSMEIYKCMVGLRKDNRDNIEEWEYGKKGMSGGYLCKGTVSYTQYAEEPTAGSQKDINGAPINAVVVTRWRDMEISSGKEKVLLTSLDTGSATKVIGLYGQRSLIENCNFRELKQAAALSQLPQKKNANVKKTAYNHMLLCVLTLAIFTVMIQTVYSDSELAKKKIAKNIREFQFMQRCEKGKIFVLIYSYFYIYDIDEFMMLAGFTFVPMD